MTEEDSSFESIMEEAERKGLARKDVERRNKRRKARGLPPLPDEDDIKDREAVLGKTAESAFTTVDSADALRLYEMRKQAMMAKEDGEDEGMADAATPAMPAMPASQIPHKFTPRETIVEEEARKKAAAVRRVEDLKNGRINHESAWSGDGEQKLEGGDAAVISPKGKKATPSKEPAPVPEQEPPYAPKAKAAWEGHVDTAPRGTSDKVAPGSKKPVGHNLRVDEFYERMEDLYQRLKVSFTGLEQSLSEIQGRVAELSTAQLPSDMQAMAARQEPEPDAETEFQALLAGKMPVTFDVGGTKMTFDAVTVFHASPCITVVSKSGSATIMPKPGARLHLTYEMDGVKYDNDPVTFLGTRFDLPMFGLSFVGFIRDQEAGMMDVDAGVSEGQ